MRFLSLVLPVFLISCSHESKPAVEPADKHWALTGKIISLNAKDQTAAIDSAAIPGFMEAMTMDYPIASKAEFATLHAGDKISGTIDQSADGSYSLSHIHIQHANNK